MLWKNTTFGKLSIKTKTDIPFKAASLMWKLNAKISVLIKLFWKLSFRTPVSVFLETWLFAFWKLRFGCIMQGICGPACPLTAVPADLLVVLICLFSFWFHSLKAHYVSIRSGSMKVDHLCTCFSLVCVDQTLF